MFGAWEPEFLLKASEGFQVDLRLTTEALPLPGRSYFFPTNFSGDNTVLIFVC